MKLCISKRRFARRGLALGLGLVYYAVFLLCYAFMIVPQYMYMGLGFNVLPGWCWGLSVAFALVPLFWMPLELERPSDFTSWILYLFLIVPSSIVVFMVTKNTPAQVVQLLTVLSVSFAVFDFTRRRRPVMIKRVINSEWLFSLALPLVTFALAFIVFKLGGFKLNLSMDDVYERRLSARGVVEGGSIAAYATAFLRSICIPIMVGVGVERRKWGYVLLALFGVIAIFSLNGTKSTVVLPAALALIVWMARSKSSNVGYWMMAGVIALLGLSVMEPMTVGSMKVSNMLVRREVVVPSQLTGYYWEFFSKNPHVMMTDTVFARFIPMDPPYEMPTARLMGLYYFSDEETNANANMWASGYAHFGYAGMIVVSVLAGLILSLFDSLSTSGRYVLASACCGTIGLIWLNGSLHTSLLTNGVLGLLFALWVFPTHSKKPVPVSDASEL